MATQTQSSASLPWWCIVLIGRRPKRTLVRIAVLVSVTFVLFRFVLAPIRVLGPSMLPTYRMGQVHVINRLAYCFHEPRRGDVVAIKYTGEHVMRLKRILGLPGETVAFEGGCLLINGRRLEEPYVRYSCDWEKPTVEVHLDEVYVVGDNRSMPREFHDEGCAQRARILGKLLL
ncbi:MAG: signal peptidase I [Limisphaerales bacterium]